MRPFAQPIKKSAAKQVTRQAVWMRKNGPEENASGSPRIFAAQVALNFPGFIMHAARYTCRTSSEMTPISRFMTRAAFPCPRSWLCCSLTQTGNTKA